MTSVSAQVPFDSVESAIQDIAAGRLVIVTDDENRENEGDAIISAELVSPEWMAWIVANTTGFLCVPMEESRANELDLQSSQGHKDALIYGKLSDLKELSRNYTDMGRFDRQN